MVKALAQAGDEPPVGAVIVHLDLLPDDALLLGDGLFGEIGVPHHAQQHIQTFVQLLSGCEEVAGAVEAGERIGVGTGLRKLGESVAVLILEHFMLQKMRHTGGQMHLPPVQAEVPVNGAEAGGVDDMGAGIARHGPHEDRQPGRKHLPLVCRRFREGFALQFRHRPVPPLWSAGNSRTASAGAGWRGRLLL